MKPFKRLALTFTLLITTALAIVGCEDTVAYAINVPVVASNLVLLDKDVDQAKAIVRSRMDSFTLKQQDQLRNAGREIQSLQSAVHNLVEQKGGVARALIQADQVRLLAQTARSAYRMARNVICPDTSADLPVTVENCPGLSAMNDVDKTRLIMFDQRVQRTRTALDALLTVKEGTDITQTVSDVLSIGSAAARVLAITSL
jgi:hypothetical protein